MQYPLNNWEKLKRGYMFGVKTFYSNFHLGLDLIVPEGTPICAPVECDIIKSMRGIQGGNTLWARWADPEYDKLVMRCMHLHSLPSIGHFKEGEIIGYTGNTGTASTGPHAHIDISKIDVNLNNIKNFIDPEVYFKARVTNTMSNAKELVRNTKTGAFYFRKNGENKIQQIPSKINTLADAQKAIGGLLTIISRGMGVENMNPEELAKLTETQEFF